MGEFHFFKAKIQHHSFTRAAPDPERSEIDSSTLYTWYIDLGHEILMKYN